MEDSTQDHYTCCYSRIGDLIGDGGCGQPGSRIRVQLGPIRISISNPSLSCEEFKCHLAGPLKDSMGTASDLSQESQICNPRSNFWI